MIMLKSTHRNPSMKILSYINIASYIILTCIYPYYNNQNTISKSLENGNKLSILLDVRTHRSLAKYEQVNELGNITLKHKTSNNGVNRKLSYIIDNNNNTYENVKRARPNHMEDYLRSSNSRYAKRNGIKKLDCYCEKKLFKSWHKIYKLAEQKNISKSRIKRIIFTKYGCLLFIISLLPLLAFSIPGNVWTVHTEVHCKAEKELNTNNYKVVHTECKYDDIIDISYRFIFVFISTIITLLLIIYIFLKVKKYRRIKSGMLK